MKIAVVGCTGKLGRIIIENILKRDDVELSSAIARRGNELIGEDISSVIGMKCNVKIEADILGACDCEVFIDCTNAESLMSENLSKYKKMNKPIVIATTGFTDKDMEEIYKLAENIPVFISGNFSVAAHDFIETLKFAVSKISDDTDVQIVEYHHNQKKDAPSKTALMIRDALLEANERLREEQINICSVRGGSIFGEHEVIFANSRDEVTIYKHQVSSRETFAAGAIDVAGWTAKQAGGLYNMDDFCDDRNGVTIK